MKWFVNCYRGIWGTKDLNLSNLVLELLNGCKYYCIFNLWSRLVIFGGSVGWVWVGGIFILWSRAFIFGGGVGWVWVGLL